MNPVSPLAIQVYEYIEQHYRLRGAFPSRDEICVALGYSKGSTIQRAVIQLRMAGWLEQIGPRAYSLCREPKTFYMEKLK